MPTAKPFKKAISIGADAQTGEPFALDLNWTRTHCHLIGPTGCGKTKLLQRIYQQLCRVPHSALVVLDPKGGLVEPCRDWAIAHGLTSRLILFEPGQGDVVLGYNPLKPNGLPFFTHAKAVREGIRSAWGQSAENFDATPQLQRFLLICLAVAREQHLTLQESLFFLYPQSPLRQSLLPLIKDPFLSEIACYLDSLSARRQEELLSSCVARLEGFLADPMIRAILTATHSLDMGEMIANHHILLVNLAKFRPLRSDDVKLLGRLLLNDLIAHVFARPRNKRTPVYLFLDEVHNFATPDLCQALDEGRELGLSCLLAHQHLHQLLDEEKSGYLYHSVMSDARTKLIFGGLSPEDLEVLSPFIFLDRLDPFRVKHDIFSLECEPINRWYTSHTHGVSHAQGRGVAWSEGFSVSQQHSRTITTSSSRAVGRHTSYGTSRAQGVASSRMQARSRARGQARAVGISSAQSAALSAGSGSGMTMLPETNEVMLESSHESTGSLQAFSYGQTTLKSSSDLEAASEGWAESVSDVEAWHQMQGDSEMWQQGSSEGESRGSSTTVSRGRTPSISKEEGESESWTATPYTTYRKRRVLRTRQFLPLEEQRLLFSQRLARQPVGHFVLKVPSKSAVFVQAPFVPTPFVSTKQLTQAKDRIFALPYYTRPADGNQPRALPLASLEQEAQEPRRKPRKFRNRS